MFGLYGWLRAVFGGWRELFLRYSFDDFGLGCPPDRFVDRSFLCLRQLAGDVGESTGAAGGNAVGGERVKEFAKNVVDVDLGSEIAAGAGEFGGEVVFPLRLFAVQKTRMRQAMAVVFGMSR